MDAWCDVHKCGPVKIRDLQNAGNVLHEQETENYRPCKTQTAIGGKMEQEIETCPACRQDQSLTNFELSKTQNAFVSDQSKTLDAFCRLHTCMRATIEAIRNLLPRKLDPPDTLNEPGPDDHVLGKVNIAWVRRCRDTEPCDTQESLERYVRAHIFCMLGTIVFPDKSTVSLNSKFLPQLRNFHRISGYSWGAANLAHLYRSLCRASRYNCKEIDGPLILLFVWAWERMPFLAPIPRDQHGNIGVESLAPTYEIYTAAHYDFRRGLDDMGIDDFIWRPYIGVGIPDGLEPHMFMCSTQSPLVSFECIEWHATDRVRRQFGMQQLPPGPAFNLGRDHCKRLTGAQNHDWGQIYSQWVNRWTFDRYNTLQLGEEIIDFHPLPVYYDWYTQQYGIHLRLSDRVPSGEIGADEPQQQQKEPAGPHQGVPAYEHHYQVPAYEHQVQMSAYAQQFQDPAYAQQFQDPAYVQQFQDPVYVPQFQDPAYAQQWPAYQQQAAYVPESQPPQAPEPYIPHLVIPAEGHFSPLGGLDTISFSEVLRDTDFLGPMQPQEGPATSHHSTGRRATSGHASDFDFDHSTGHVDPLGPSAPPCGQLFDLNEYPQQEEGDLGSDLEHWYDLGGASAPGIKNFIYYKLLTSGAWTYTLRTSAAAMSLASTYSAPARTTHLT
ncbi:hypothetical protein Ahy_B07g087869 [Arachis hypogaea]|uniref:Aminotransferase-like plant mobile domain-containing protein n=1 Tax=Arachis hypogaea TaxID=3818 RepID=A0A444YD72_ARAHY|nr:hypothetical protein Ahy_B07g087869 [Arachis hypogaea]